VGRPRCESSVSEPGTDEVRVHAVRLGGRRRLDTSRVFFTCGSQGLQVQEGASREEVRSTADAGHGWVEGETVRVREAIKQIPRAWPAGLGLQALDTTEGVLGLLPVLLSPAGRSEGPLVRRSTPRGYFPGQPGSMLDDGQHVGRLGCRLGCACGRQRGRQRSTRSGEGSSRSDKDRGGSASSTLKRRRSQRCARS
jgi:hypothetical protein